MKASRFSEAQKAFILRQGNDGMPVTEICRKAGISQATYFNWKKKYDGLLPTEMRRLKQLEDENAKLRKVVARPLWRASVGSNRCLRYSRRRDCWKHREPRTASTQTGEMLPFQPFRGFIRGMSI